jgi:hypothetical protein
MSWSGAVVPPTPRTAATQQIIRACRASLAAAQGFFPDVQASLAA